MSGGSTTLVRPIIRAPWAYVDSPLPESASSTQLVSTCGQDGDRQYGVAHNWPTPCEERWNSTSWLLGSGSRDTSSGGTLRCRWKLTPSVYDVPAAPRCVEVVGAVVIESGTLVPVVLRPIVLPPTPLLVCGRQLP